MRPIALSARALPADIPVDTILKLTGGNLESIAQASEASPPLRIELTDRSLRRIMARSHSGDWTVAGSYGSTLILIPHTGAGPDLPQPPGTLMERPAWTTFTKEKVIEYYDGPRAILRQDRNGQDYLCLWRESTPNTTRWLHIPLSPERLSQVLTGAQTIRDAFRDSNFVYFMDEDNDLNPVRTVMTLPSSVAWDHPIMESIPEAGVYLSLPPEVFREWQADTATEIMSDAKHLYIEAEPARQELVHFLESDRYQQMPKEERANGLLRNNQGQYSITGVATAELAGMTWVLTDGEWPTAQTSSWKPSRESNASQPSSGTQERNSSSKSNSTPATETPMDARRKQPAPWDSTLTPGAIEHPETLTFHPSVLTADLRRAAGIPQKQEKPCDLDLLDFSTAASLLRQYPDLLMAPLPVT